MTVPPLHEIYADEPQLTNAVWDLKTKYERLDETCRVLCKHRDTRRAQLQDYKEALAHLRAKQVVAAEEKEESQ